MKPSTFTSLYLSPCGDFDVVVILLDAPSIGFHSSPALNTSKATQHYIQNETKVPKSPIVKKSEVSSTEEPKTSSNKAPEPYPGQCHANIPTTGERCRRYGDFNGFCGLHYNNVETCGDIASTTEEQCHYLPENGNYCSLHDPTILRCKEDIDDNYGQASRPSQTFVNETPIPRPKFWVTDEGEDNTDGPQDFDHNYEHVSRSPSAFVDDVPSPPRRKRGLIVEEESDHESLQD
ncbi:hypothetical protein BGX26_002025, partial [Mortierella sp. AD094]